MSTPFYDLASLVLVPSGYKASKVYAQKPLTTDGQLTFSRASTATRVNASGLIETVSSNVPRLDYLGSTCPKLLLEPSRTNAILQSQALNTTWTDFGTGTTVTPNATTAPDGTLTADLVSFSALTSPNQQVLAQVLTLTTGVPYTISFYAKAVTGTVTNLVVRINGAEVSLGQTITTTWQRFTKVITPVTATDDSGFKNRPAVSGSGAAIDVYMWGVQIEQGAYATSYIPTTTAAVTRLADDLGTINMAVLTPGSAYSLFFEITESALTTASSWMFLGSSTGSGDPFQIYASTAILNTSSGYVYPYSYASQSNASGKACISYNGTTVAVFLNGVKQGQWTANAIWANKTTWDLTFDQSQKINYKKVLTFPSALTDAQAIEITTL